MANVSLSDLIAKIRKITARPSPNQITDATIIDYANLFYESDFPQNLKLFDFRTTYSFITQPNVDQYTLSQTDRNLYKSFEPPVYCSGYYTNYYQNREQFFRFWPSLSTSMQLITATGVAGPYTGTLNALPVLQNNVLISVVGPAGNTLTAQDDGNGFFVGDVVPVVSNINYITGVINVTWNAAIPAGNIITARWVPYQPSRPLAVLFYDNVFTLRPVPDQAYKIEMQSYIRPFAVLPQILPNPEVEVEYSLAVPTALPLLEDYFQLIAYGAARKIFLDSMEMENLANIEPFYREQMNYAERKTMMQIKTQRTQTIYSENMYWNANRLPTT